VIAISFFTHRGNKCHEKCFLLFCGGAADYSIIQVHIVSYVTVVGPTYVVRSALVRGNCCYLIELCSLLFSFESMYISEH